MAKKRAEPVSVLVVDDHRTFAEALALAFRLEKEFAVEVVVTGQAAVEAVERLHPDVVFMDVEMPGMDGIVAIRRIKDADPSTAVLVLSAHDDDILKGRALEAGASGYVSKLTGLEELPKMARRAHKGEPLIEPQEVIRLLRVLRRRRHQESTERQRVNRLTPKQTEILQLMADGLSPPAIAKQLGMSPYTLRTHVQNILTRMGVHTKLEAVAMAIRHGKIKADA
jgi:DNA-binding NarL/FixJ family response regulator